MLKYFVLSAVLLMSMKTCCMSVYNATEKVITIAEPGRGQKREISPKELKTNISSRMRMRGPNVVGTYSEWVYDRQGGEVLRFRTNLGRDLKNPVIVIEADPENPKMLKVPYAIEYDELKKKYDISETPSEEKKVKAAESVPSASGVSHSCASCS